VSVVEVILEGVKAGIIEVMFIEIISLNRGGYLL
jgi:hypothetical protein